MGKRIRMETPCGKAKRKGEMDAMIKRMIKADKERAKRKSKQ